MELSKKLGGNDMRYEKPEIEVFILKEAYVIRTSVGTENVVPDTGVQAPGEDEW